MRTRDPDTKRRLLLEAALAEFAARGVAGARVEQIARRAGISAGLVYSFYENKDGLFEAVFDWIVEQAVSTVPIDTADLGEYAGRLHDAGLAYPEVTRFIAWYELERGGPAARRAATVAAMKAKVDAIADAQRQGAVSDRYPATELLALVLALANMWQWQSGDYLDLVPAAWRRALIVDAVRQLAAP
jgi:AcrR family transcriptional regulator